MEGVSADSLHPVGLLGGRAVLRRARAANPPGALWGRPLSRGIPGLHHAGPRCAAGGGAGDGGAAPGSGGDARVPPHNLRRIPRGAGGGGRGSRGQRTQLALPAGYAGHARCGHRRGASAGGRTRLCRQQVEPRNPGPAPAGLDLQAVRLLRGAPGGDSAVARDCGRAVQPAGAGAGPLDPAEL